MPRPVRREIEMKLLENKAQVRDIFHKLYCGDSKIGLVLLKGNIHEGNLSLIRKAREMSEKVVVCLCCHATLLKNLQPLSAIEQNREKDFRILEQEAVDYTFVADAERFLPAQHRTFIHPPSFAECFQRFETEEYMVLLATVYFKALNLFHPTFVFMGRNEYTDFLLLKRIIRDYSYSAEVVLCPTVRDEDGIPYSQMYPYFGEQQRVDAERMYSALREARRLLIEGEQSASVLTANIRHSLGDLEERDPFFVGILEPETLQNLEKVEQQAVILLIAQSGDFRLADNIVYRRHEE